MGYSGKAVRLEKLNDGLFELIFDLKDESANRFNQVTVDDLHEALNHLEKEKGVRGLLMSSAKDSFVMGADITEFGELFKKPDAEFEAWMTRVHKDFSRIEDLPYPVVCLIRGFSLGGGFEVALSAHFRVATVDAKIGLPETKLGIFPGWGGTIRLPRLIGADNAMEWIAGGKHYKPAEAMKFGAVDAVVEVAASRDAALRMLKDAADGKLDWKSRAEKKKAPLRLEGTELAMTFGGGKAFIAGMAGPNYPAPVAAVEVMEATAKMTRDAAIPVEVKGFVKICKTPQAGALIGVFLGDQLLKRKSKKASKEAKPVKSAAVLGAGIMGGGIAYQSASSKIPVVMKDIREAALDLGMKEASKLLDKRVEKGQIKSADMAKTLSMIRAALSYDEIKEVDMVVEAVVENEKVKASVLAETEAAVKPGTIIASNTSTISISRLAKNLKHPENFVGMHFFNPVHRMPLVEIIRGEKSSPAAVATAVAYATAMGKSAVVVNDCPGFLVNRVLFPYLIGFNLLMRDGVPFERIDKVMEKFGWPMGPAYLLDVVGIDTGHHAMDVMAAGFPERMKFDFESVLDVQYKAGRFGQKNGKGFYTYSQDPKGKPIKAAEASVYDLLKPVMKGDGSSVTDEEIVERMMLPMVFECVRCIEDGIVDGAVDIDLSMLYGLGFPPFRGGVMRYADSVGAAKLADLSGKYSKLGKMYEAPKMTHEMAKAGSGPKGRFYV
ncbi:MAG: fatty acid oxidation complex subunit alpha FadB [Bdellovibrionales bacterium]|nr:fatty acid oxidation complex subunit alpha FadB [Bdellovibrionales bacterium]